MSGVEISWKRKRCQDGVGEARGLEKRVVDQKPPPDIGGIRRGVRICENVDQTRGCCKSGAS